MQINLNILCFIIKILYLIKFVLHSQKQFFYGLGFDLMIFFQT